MTERKALALQYLNATFNLIKNKEKLEGFALMWLNEIIELSYLNEYQELMNAALALKKAKSGNILKRAFANFKFIISDATHKLQKDKSAIEKKYSYQNVIHYLAPYMQANANKLFVNNIRTLDQALQLAKDDLDLEMVACSLCINHYFEEASRMIKNELKSFDYRIWVVKVVMCIELFRMDEFDKAKNILDEIYPEKNNCWTNLQFAKGILGYQPWDGYPFSDY
ncbi:MAG: hypothetical protein J7604_07770 [Sporocytophaga sp.]|uniref:hypothetical protein n=1 Tax=Sporocytophaga sp. TaxID=2231183 RepID=UPI001B1C534E|nr:hypothetical protein [Sporocytophaga sp.]MBO9700094.1 hypothetical protein [Sporocytophaga sp.]